MRYEYNDGGRKAAGYKGETGDCGCRALAIALDIPYQEAYDMCLEECKRDRITKRKRTKSHPRTGVFAATFHRIMDNVGWEWVATMGIGTGCKVHLKDGELPMGRIITRVSSHYAAVEDGVLHDTRDCSRSGRRCVYGYWLNNVRIV